VEHRRIRVKLLLLYVLLLKATVTTFGGTATLPVVREDIVVRHRLLSDRELNLAFTAGRSGPGPNGIYLVSVGYLIAGLPGACVGWLAMITPAFLVIPLVRFVGARADRPRLLGAIRASTAAGAGLLLAANVPMARDALTSGFLAMIAVASFAVFSFTRIDSVWAIVGAALVGLVAASVAMH
jgi:chromate transporter